MTRIEELRGVAATELVKLYRAATGREDGGRITQLAKIEAIIAAESSPKVHAEGELGEEEVVEVTGPSGP